jgi:hypothetical protein
MYIPCIYQSIHTTLLSQSVSQPHAHVHTQNYSRTHAGDSYDVESAIHIWNEATNRFVLHQGILTHGAVDVATSSIAGTMTVLAFANSIGTASQVRISTRSYEYVGSTSNSGCALAFSIWRPAERPGYRRIGHAVVADECDFPESRDACLPTEPAVLLLDGPWLARPARYEYVGQHVGRFANASSKVKVDSLHMWRPVPQQGYRCLGHVAVVGNSSAPNLEEIRCVSEGLLQPSDIRYAKNLDLVEVDEQVTGDEVRAELRKTLRCTLCFRLLCGVWLRFLVSLWLVAHRPTPAQ